MTCRPTLSLIVITRNEEELIGQCLRSAAFCDELVVVDSFSTDRTGAIAEELGARVFRQEFTNYVDQKQISLDYATSEWVLLLDADEQVTWDLEREIEATLAAPNPADGYRIRRVLYHLRHFYTRPIYPDRPVRLFRRVRGHIGGVDPHDKVVVDGRIGQLKAPILHFSYDDIADHIATINRFTSRSANELPMSSFAVFQMLADPVWRFFSFYILRGGFLDGGRGLYAAMTSAFYGFLKYAKLYERRLNSVRPR
ncbi:MAG TPA: glycosyltransferase family 2 protein [Candidatus Binataceae bacterium]|nr:glycosyltransferase family 2 protein [Candidatus Binataceae bacterium]